MSHVNSQKDMIGMYRIHYTIEKVQFFIEDDPCITFVELKCPMYAKFQDHRTFDSKKRRFFKELYEHNGRLGHVTKTIYINSWSLFKTRHHIKFRFVLA